MDFSQNKFCQTFKVDLPLLNAPMPGISGIDLVSEVCNAGGLGVLPGDFLAANDLSRAIDALRERTDRPFAVNLRVPSARVDQKGEEALEEALSSVKEDLGCVGEKFELPDFEAQLKIVIEKKIPVLSVSFGGLREIYLDRVKEAGIRVIGVATSLLEAKVQKTAGADAIVVQGSEAGGPRLNFEQSDSESLIGLMSLIGPAARATGLPVVASGGLMTREQVEAAFALGAEAVQLGSYFIRAKESLAHPEFKETLPYIKDSTTRLTRLFDGRLTRVVPNGLLQALEDAQIEALPYPTQLSVMKPILDVAICCDRVDLMEMCAGQGAMLARQDNVKNLIGRLWSMTR